MHHVLVFDLDYVLFDAKRYKDLLVQKLAEASNDTEVGGKFTTAYTEVKKVGYFEPKQFASFLVANGVALSEEQILSLVYDQTIIASAFYPDVVETLTALSQKHTLVLFSTNDAAFFQAKIQTIAHLFTPDHIFVSKNKGEIIHAILAFTNENSVYYVDDILDNLQFAKTADAAIITVWKKTKGYVPSENAKEFQPDGVISDISELEGILNKTK